MTDNRHLRIIRSLIDKTNNAEIEWEPMGPLNSYQTAFADYTVRVYTDQEDDFILKILDEDRRLIESVNQYEVREVVALHEAARRAALRVDEVLDTLLEELEG